MAKKKQVRKVDIERNERAIRHNRINKKTGAIIACICVVVFLAGIFGLAFGGYKIAEYYWNKEIGEESGVAFNELFGILNGVSKTDESKIVVNKYSEDDLEIFYTNIKNKLYLSADYDLDITKLLSGIFGNSETTTEDSSEPQVSTVGTDGYDLRYVYTYSDGRVVESEIALADENQDTSQDENTNPGSTGNEALDTFLQELEFDFSSLENYKGEKNILEISDKQLAAVIDEIYGSLSDIFPQINSVEEKLGKPLEELIEVKQIIINSDITKPQDVQLKLTVGLNARDALSKTIDDKGLPPFLKNLIPKHLYATVIAYPFDNTKAVQASLNQLSEVNVDKIVSIVDVILQKAKVEFNIHDMLVKVNTKVVEVLEKAQEKIPLSFVNSGSVDMYPIETLMKTLKVDISEQAFLYMMRDIKLPTEESLGYDIYTPERKEQETTTFVNDLVDKYCIDNSQNIITTTNTISDVVNLASSQNFLQNIQIKNMQYTNEYSNVYYRAKTSYVALANMLTKYVNDENMLGNIKAEFINMTYDKSKSILGVEIKVKVSEMLGIEQSGAMANLINQLVPEEIFVKANICLDENLNIVTTMDVNKVGVEKSKEHLATLTALANSFGMNVENIDYDKICQQIDSGVRQGLQKIKDALNCDIIFEEEGAYLPNVFELVSANEKVNGNLEEGEHIITDGEVWELMKGLYDYEYVDDGSFVPADNISNFIDELYNKFFISDSFKQELIDSQANETFLDVLKKGVGVNFGTDKVRLKDKTIELPDGGFEIIDGIMSKNNITPVYNEQYITEKFKPVFMIEEIAYLINTQSQILSSLSFLKDLKVIYAYNNTDEMSLIVEGKGNIEDQSINSLLPEKINVNIILNLGEINADGTRDDLLVNSLKVNDIDDMSQSASMNRLDLLLLFISRISRGSDVEQEEMTTESTKKKIEEGLNEDIYEEDGVTVKTVCLKNQIHNDVYTVTFLEDGGFRVNQTIYEIVINELYKTEDGSEPYESEIPSENDFRNAICKINNMPDSTIYTSSDRKDFVIDLLVGNKAENANNAIDEINNKYFLNDSHKLSYDITTGNVFDSISAKATSYATSINGQAMANTALSFNELKPVIDGSEMLVMLENSITITAKGYENAKMTGLYITRSSSAMTADKGELLLVFNSPLDKSIVDAKYQELMPDKLALLVLVDMNKLSAEICTNIYVNDLTTSEMFAINALMKKVTDEKQPDGSTSSMNINEVNSQCSESVKKTMSELTNNMQLTLTEGITSETEGVQSTTPGQISLESIYEVASKKLSTQDNEITPSDLQSVLKALFANFELNGYTEGATNITDTADESQKNNYNIFIEGNIIDMSATVEGAIGEGNLMSKLDMSKIGQSFNVTSAEQTAFIPMLANDSQNDFAILRDEFRLDDTKEYFVITFKISSKEIVGNTTSSEEITILPQHIYTTFCVDLSSDTSDIHIIYNKLDSQQEKTLESIISKNQGETPDSCLSKEKLDSMKSDLLSTVLLNYTYEGYGQMQLTLDDVIKSNSIIIRPNDNTNTAVDGKGMMTFNITKAMERF